MIAIMIIGLLAGMLMPNFESARVESQTNACVNNLRVINAGKTSAAFELSLSTGMSVPEADLLKYLGGDGVAPVCPANGTYTYNPIGTTATCTIADHVYLTN